jgi:hypothetical protein
MFLACFTHFEKINVGLWDHLAVHVSVCVFPLINFWMPEPIFMELGMHVMAREPISTAYFMNPSHQSVCLYVYPLIVARQRLGKNVTRATNTHALLSMRLVLPGTSCLAYFPEVVSCDIHPVCVSVYHPLQLLNAWTGVYETWYACHGNWVNINGVLNKFLPSVFLSVCVFLLSLQGNGSVKVYPSIRC